MGDYLVADRTMPFFRDNPMGGDYQDYVGGKYHVMETSAMIIQKDSITNYAGR